MHVYMNNDERLGESVKFTIAEMLGCYRDNNWDFLRRHDGSVIRRMTDAEIIEDILDHDITDLGDEVNSLNPTGAERLAVWQARAEKDDAATDDCDREFFSTFQG